MKILNLGTFILLLKMLDYLIYINFYTITPKLRDYKIRVRIAEMVTDHEKKSKNTVK